MRALFAQVSILQVDWNGAVQCSNREGPSYFLSCPLPRRPAIGCQQLLWRKRPGTELTAAQSQRVIENGRKQRLPGWLHEMFRRMRFQLPACARALSQALPSA